MTEQDSHQLRLNDRLQWLLDAKDHGTVIDLTPHHIRVKWDNDGITLMHRTELKQISVVKE